MRGIWKIGFKKRTGTHILIKDAFKIVEQKMQLEALKKAMEQSKEDAVQRAGINRGHRRKASEIDPILKMLEKENKDLQLRPAKKMYKLKKKKKKKGKITDFFNYKPRKNQ